MPKEPEELGATTSPTAVTSVVESPRDSQPTAESSVDPKWAESPSLGFAATVLSQKQPAEGPVPAAGASFWRHTVHEYKKLPSRTRSIIVVSAALIWGLVLGLLVAPKGKSVAPEDELVQHAQRLAMPERGAIAKSLELSDPYSALAMLRAMSAKEHLDADPLGRALRGRLALLARDPVDALDNLELAVARDVKMLNEPWLAPAVVQTFQSAKTHARTHALLARLPRADVLAALKGACLDWQFRVRHAASDSLESNQHKCPDVVGSTVLDGWQADRCDTARAAVARLLALPGPDDRVTAALDAMSRRPSIANCVADLIPRAGPLMVPPPPAPTK